MNKRGVRIIKVVNGELNVYFPVGIKHKLLKFDNVTLIFCPERNILELVPSFWYGKPAMKHRTQLAPLKIKMVGGIVC